MSASACSGEQDDSLTVLLVKRGESGVNLYT
jgi:hypothetical protein